LRDKTIAILGAGKMGGALATALIQSDTIKPERLRATVRSADRAAQLAEKASRLYRPSLSQPKSAASSS